MILEELETAKKRGATIYGEICGSGSGFSASGSLEGKAEIALANAMRAALVDAHAEISEVGHIHAHGLATTKADAAEAQAIRSVFKERTGSIPVTAAKSFFGNLGAGSGTVELMASLLSLQNKSLCPTLNYATADPTCPLNISTEANANPGSSFLNLSFTPQGQASAVFVRGWAE